MNSIFHISCYKQIHKFQSLLKLFNSSANIKLSKTQLHKIGQSGGFLGKPFQPLLKSGLPLIENILKPLVESILIPLGLTVVALATDAVIRKKMFESGPTTLIISNEEINNIMKIVKSLEESGLLIKSVSQTITYEAKEQRGFTGMLLGTLGASSLGNLLTGKGVIVTNQGHKANMPGWGTIRVGEGTIRAGKIF